MKWLKDPDTGRPSVSLTSYVISGLLVVAACIANLFNPELDPDNLMQLFWSIMALYFGRRFDFKKYKRGAKHNENSIGEGQRKKATKRTRREIDQGD